MLNVKKGLLNSFSGLLTFSGRPRLTEGKYSGGTVQGLPKSTKLPMLMGSEWVDQKMKWWGLVTLVLEYADGSVEIKKNSQRPTLWFEC